MICLLSRRMCTSPLHAHVLWAVVVCGVHGRNQLVLPQVLKAATYPGPREHLSALEESLRHRVDARLGQPGHLRMCADFLTRPVMDPEGLAEVVMPQVQTQPLHHVGLVPCKAHRLAHVVLHILSDLPVDVVDREERVVARPRHA